MTGWKLKRVRQCGKCPWKVSTDPHDIPHGYCEKKHANLASTIAEPGSLRGLGGMRLYLADPERTSFLCDHRAAPAHCE